MRIVKLEHIIKLGIENISVFEHFEKKENRNNVLRQIKSIEEVTVRQLSIFPGRSSCPLLKRTL